MPMKSMMPMLPKQKKMTPTKMILGLTYLDMLHHTQSKNIQQINEKQREILKPFLKKNKNKHKTSKIQRGGHVFYYSVLPDICGLDVHGMDCVPSTLYFLGLLTHEAATYLAEQRESGIDARSVIEWLDESFPNENAHTYSEIIDLRDIYLRTNRRGKHIYNRRLIDSSNDRLMRYLNFILPHNQMGVMAGSVYFSENNNQESVGGHVFCIIKNEYGQIVIIDPQSRKWRVIDDTYDMIHFLDELGAYTLNVYIQEGSTEGFNSTNHELPDPNNFEVADPNAFNVNRLLTINRNRDGYYNENEEYMSNYDPELDDDSEEEEEEEEEESEEEESGYYNRQGYYRNPDGSYYRNPNNGSYYRHPNWE